MSPALMTYAALTVAIVLEVIGTTFLQKSQQFSRPVPTLVTLVAYGGAFFFLSVALKTLPLGVAYAMWSGLGIVLVTAAGYLVFRQGLDAPALLGIGLIITGVAVINLFSKTAGH